MRSRLLLLFATAVCILTADVRLHACTCSGPQPPCQAAWYATAVFVGDVTRIEDVEQSAAGLPVSLAARRVAFRVTESLRGDLGETAVVHTARDGAACGYAFQMTKSYLVYAHQGPDGTLVTSICTRTRPQSQAGEDLEYLRGQARQPSSLGTIYGRAVGPDPTLDYPSIERSPPYVGGRVVVEAVDPASTGRFEAVTDGDGRYSIKVPVGRYRAALEVREGLYAVARGLPEVLDTRGCGETNFLVRSDGRIRGRVVDAEGQPVSGLSVDLLPEAAVAQPYFMATTRVHTDADGRFEFARLAPGSYRLGLMLVRDRGDAEPTAVWLSAQPGGGEPVRIGVGAEERAETGDLSLPRSVSLTRVTGIVRDEGGAPARAANVYVLTSPRLGIAAGPLAVDATGAFTFTVVAGRTYRLSAEINDGPGRLRRAESEPFLAGPDLKPFSLTMPGRAADAEVLSGGLTLAQRHFR